MEQVRRGLMTKQEAEHSEIQNIILRALGSEDNVEPDLDDMIAQPGDTLLMCSDGLSKEVPDADMLRLIQSASSLDAACDALIAAARKAGGDDNITCMLLRFADEPWYRRWFRRKNGKPQWQDSM
jgi:protein phosphatase